MGLPKTIEMCDFEVGVAMFPKLKKRWLFIGSLGYGMASKTKHKKESWDLLKLILSTQSQREMALNAKAALPIRKSLFKDKGFINKLHKAKLIPGNFNTLVQGFGIGSHVRTPYPEVGEIFERETENLLFNDKDPLLTVQKINKEINAFLKVQKGQ